MFPGGISSAAESVFPELPQLCSGSPVLCTSGERRSWNLFWLVLKAIDDRSSGNRSKGCFVSRADAIIISDHVESQSRRISAMASSILPTSSAHASSMISSSIVASAILRSSGFDGSAMLSIQRHAVAFARKRAVSVIGYLSGGLSGQLRCSADNAYGEW
jgi:hypothetical protein